MFNFGRFFVFILEKKTVDALEMNKMCAVCKENFTNYRNCAEYVRSSVEYFNKRFTFFKK